MIDVLEFLTFYSDYNVKSPGVDIYFLHGPISIARGPKYMGILLGEYKNIVILSSTDFSKGCRVERGHPLISAPDNVPVILSP